MAETWTLTAPVTRPPKHSYSMKLVALDAENATVKFGWRDNVNEWHEHTYTDPVIAMQIIRGLRKANLSTKSMDVRAFERLVADGVIGAGAASGTPD